MTDSTETEVTGQELVHALAKKYGDFILYTVQCRNTDDAASCLRRLSFVTRASLAEMKTPANVRTLVVEAKDGAVAIVAGQLTSDQHREVCHLIKDLGNPYDIHCDVKEGSAAQREFSQATMRLERERTPAKKKWWQIWR